MKEKVTIPTTAFSRELLEKMHAQIQRGKKAKGA